MSYTLAAYYESIQTSGSLEDINAVTDQSLTTKGTDIIVPQFAGSLMALYGRGATLTGVQITSPSLRERSMLDVGKYDTTATVTDEFAWIPLYDKPVPLVPGEAMRFLVSNSASSAEGDIGLVVLGNEITPAPDGIIQTIKATTTIAASSPNGKWVLAADINITQQLHAGMYALVGMRVMGTGIVGARAIIPGSAYRPGVLGLQNATQDDPVGSRRGETGSWGEFDSIYPPQIEVIGASLGTAVNVWLDLVKVA